MRFLNTLVLATSLAGSVGAVGLSHVALAEIQTVAMLDRAEPFEANVFHSNLLWVGNLVKISIPTTASRSTITAYKKVK